MCDAGILEILVLLLIAFDRIALEIPIEFAIVSRKI